MGARPVGTRTIEEEDTAGTVMAGADEVVRAPELVVRGMTTELVLVVLTTTLLVLVVLTTVLEVEVELATEEVELVEVELVEVEVASAVWETRLPSTL